MSKNLSAVLTSRLTLLFIVGSMGFLTPEAAHAATPPNPVVLTSTFNFPNGYCGFTKATIVPAYTMTLSRADFWGWMRQRYLPPWPRHTPNL